MITMFVARAGGGKNVLSLVLGGIVTSAFFAALVLLVKYTADPQDVLPTIVYWLLGSYNESSFRDVLFILIPMLTAGLLIYKMRYVTNILSLGEEEARSMGINVDFSRWAILLSSAVIISAIVSVSGIVDWVGLIIPHQALHVSHKVLLVKKFAKSVYGLSKDTLSEENLS